MAVTAEYLAKLRRAVRRGENAEVDAELTDIIEEVPPGPDRAGSPGKPKRTMKRTPLILGRSAASSAGSSA